MTNEELLITNTATSIKKCSHIPDEARLPESSESTLGYSSLLSEHTPAYRFPS